MAWSQKYKTVTNSDLAAFTTAVQAQLDLITALGNDDQGNPNYSYVQVETIYDGTDYIAALSYQSNEPAS